MQQTDEAERIAVLGAGPIGLEAALYGRYLGYDVQVFERGRVCENLRQFGHVRLFSPFETNASPLGISALEAQEPSWRPPDPSALMTACELVKAYFEPLSQSDLLADRIHTEARIISISRDGPGKQESIGQPERGDSPFRLLLRKDESRAEFVERADIVIDATGAYGNHRWAGPGGGPAAGECSHANRIDYGLPDIVAHDRSRFAGKRTLVVGSGYSAATNIVTLAELQRADPTTHVSWIVRGRNNENEAWPIERMPNDRLVERDILAAAANRWAQDNSNALLDGAVIESFSETPAGRISVTLRGDEENALEFDNVLANVGWRPDLEIYRELQVHTCYATEGPIKLAASLLANTSADCLDQSAGGPELLRNPEPNFFVLGSKSFGRNSRFLLSIGLEQIRDAFTLIGERADLDLYQSCRRTHP